MLYPLKFKPIFKYALWGGSKILSYKGLDYKRAAVGECWELSAVQGSESVVVNGEFAGRTITEVLEQCGAELIGADNFKRFGSEFPLLVKFIDAKHDLSIQVHPDEVLARKRHRSHGKCEMWYIVSADSDTRLMSGFSAKVDKKEYEERLKQGTLTQVLQHYNVKVGDLYHIPPGCIHSVGAGCFIVEIQQTSDITYRVYDYDRRDQNGNLRELHTEFAAGAIDFGNTKKSIVDYDKELRNTPVDLIDCPYFTTSLLDLESSYTWDLCNEDKFQILICVTGEAMLTVDIENPVGDKISKSSVVSLRQGETILVPATTKKIDIQTKSAKILIATV